MAGPTIPTGPYPPSKEDLDAKLAAFDTVPLFMKSLPSDDTEDTALAALQSLAHEGTPDEVAQNFKEQGNEYFRGKRYREALGFYTQGVDAEPTDVVLQEALLCNRAACNLELQNYGSVLRDCSKALTLNSRSSKAFYRSASALLALDRTEEALDCCDRCLAFDPGNKGVLQLRDRASQAKAAKDRKEKEKADRLRKEQEAKRQMDIAFRERSLISLPKADGSSNPYEPHFDAEDSTHSTLVFPVFFLYPQHATSDVIQEFVEDTPFGAHLAAMFPPQAPAPEWDKNGEYVEGQLVVYAMTHRKRLLKVGKKMTLRDVCKAAKAKEGEKRDGLEVKDGCLTFVVLPKGEVEAKWVEEYKRTRDAEAR
ncbi:putative tpr repeat protein [Lyophyllum shimeji]|uniref:Tpr repeat protein n=1 Tax=Lyophyllum shimeji TaxID=47721 RepID=A0A9P3PDF8_LYOSH|nr:putative tpr repeat protein [Lyophyllum shimeji]